MKAIVEYLDCLTDEVKTEEIQFPIIFNSVNSTNEPWIANSLDVILCEYIISIDLKTTVYV